MSAQMPQRRTDGFTARETAAKWGVSERQLRRRIAEPREEWRARAAARRERVLALRAQGLTYAQIEAETGVPMGTVGRLLHEAKKLAEAQTADEQSQAS